jgi:hypothetical protein
MRPRPYWGIVRAAAAVCLALAMGALFLSRFVFVKELGS